MGVRTPATTSSPCAFIKYSPRITFSPEDGGTPAEQLWREASLEGAIACGFEDAGGTIELRRDHPALALVEDDDLLDAIVFSGTPALFA